MNRRTKIGIGVVTGLLVLAGGGIGVAEAVSGDGDEVGGPAGDQARAAAAQAVPGGTAGAVEADTEDGVAYGVTVTKPDGSSVEVHLDQAFHVLGTPMPADADHDDDKG